MKSGKVILLLGSMLGLFTILAGCDRVDTSDPNATPKPTTDKIDITDDFSNPSSGWGESPSGAVDYHCYSNGVYKMHLTGGTTKYIAVPFNSILDADKGYTIQVEVTNSTTENASVGGLFFNSTGSDGGIFVIDPKNQQYAVQNGWSSLKWSEVKTIIKKSDPNILKVVVSGTQASLWINGTDLGIGIRVPNHLGEKVGLYFSFKEEEKKTDYTMTYDNFVLKGTKYSSN